MAEIAYHDKHFLPFSSPQQMQKHVAAITHVIVRHEQLAAV